MNKNNLDDIILQSDSVEELKDLKSFLFRENIRIMSEKKELQSMKEKFLKEKVEFQEEMKTLNRKMVQERKRLREDTLFFDKKMDILKSGFASLDAERRKFEREKLAFNSSDTERMMSVSNNTMFFAGISTSAGLKKRYRELMKLYHPDNDEGSIEASQIIRREYERLKRVHKGKK